MENKKQADGNSGQALMFGQRLQPNHKIAGTWFMDMRDKPDDVNPHANIGALLIEKEDEGVYVFGWRFRVFMDGRIHESNDVRLPYQNVIPMEGVSREEALKRAQDIVLKWSETWNAQVHYEHYGWITPQEMFKKIKENPPAYMHMTKKSVENAPQEAKEVMENIKDRSKYRI